MLKLLGDITIFIACCNHLIFLFGHCNKSFDVALQAVALIIIDVVLTFKIGLIIQNLRFMQPTESSASSYQALFILLDESDLMNPTWMGLARQWHSGHLDTSFVADLMPTRKGPKGNCVSRSWPFMFILYRPTSAWKCIEVLILLSGCQAESGCPVGPLGRVWAHWAEYGPTQT
jgi:hypothetical protein